MRFKDSVREFNDKYFKPIFVSRNRINKDESLETIEKPQTDKFIKDMMKYDKSDRLHWGDEDKLGSSSPE